MEDNTKLLESLVERVTDYAETSFELVKLKTLDKTTDAVSSLVPHSVVFLLVASFIIFLTAGLALWLGDVLGKTYYGFFVVAAFYVLAGIVVHLFMHKRIKKIIGDYFINSMRK